MPLSSDEIERYARHIVLRDIGGPGQNKLKAARVLVVGAGGLGSPVIQYLAAPNPHVRVELHPVRVTALNAEALAGAYDIVVDGSDNFATRYAVSDACF